MESKDLFKNFLILIILLITLIGIFILQGDFIRGYLAWLRQGVLAMSKTTNLDSGFSQSLNSDLSDRKIENLISKEQKTVEKNDQETEGLVVEQGQKEVKQSVQTTETVTNQILDEIKKELESINQKIQELKKEITQIIKLNEIQKEVDQVSK